MRSSVVLVLALVLCAALCAGDRRRSERTEGDNQRVQQRRRDGDGERGHHHHHDAQRQHHHHHDEEEDGNDSDDEGDDGDDNHHHHHRFVDLADSDGSHWGHGHDHGERRPESDRRGGKRPAQDNRKDVKKNGQKDGKKNGKNGGQSSEGRRGGDRTEHEHHNEHHHHQEDRRREGSDRSEHHQHRGDAPSKKNHSKNAKQTSPRSEERHNSAVPAAEPQPQSLAADSDSEELSAAAQSLAAAMAASESDLTPMAAEDDADAGAEPLPPPHQDVAAMARYIVHVSDWAAMATISSRPPTRGMPFANVFSVCDGTRYRSTGIPYLYLTDMEISVQDLRVNNSASLTMSLAQSDFCRRRGYDPEDPLCAHVILSGRVLQVDEHDPEFAFARDALFARHPEMSDWPTDHHFFVAYLDIMNIIVLDFFGGAKTVPVSEYFATNPFKVHPRRENML